MYYTLYDRHFNSIGETYLLESWIRIQRAHDFDETKIVGEKIPASIEPFFVTVNNRQGGVEFSGLAGTPDINEKTQKTQITLKDYTTLWNSEIVVYWEYPFKDVYSTLDKVIDNILSSWVSSVDVGFSGIQWDTSRIEDIMMEETFGYPSGKEVLHVYDVILGLMYEYNVYCNPVLDLYQKTLTFEFRKCNLNYLSIRLEDFNVTNVAKSFGEHNRSLICDSYLNPLQTWALTTDNEVVKLPSEKPLIYPAKTRVYVADSGDTEEEKNQNVNQSIYEAVMDLAENRYQENIDLNVVFAKSIIDLTEVDFSYTIGVWFRGEFYRDLPVGEIEQDSKGTHIVRIGYRPLELTQEI